MDSSHLTDMISHFFRDRHVRKGNEVGQQQRHLRLFLPCMAVSCQHRCSPAPALGQRRLEVRCITNVIGHAPPRRTCSHPSLERRRIPNMNPVTLASLNGCWCGGGFWRGLTDFCSLSNGIRRYWISGSPEMKTIFCFFLVSMQSNRKIAAVNHFIGLS